MITEQENSAPATITPLISGIIHDSQTLIGQQLSLFANEIKNDLRKTKEASIPLIVGGVVALITGIILAITLAHLLVYLWPEMHLVGGFGIVGLVLAVITGALLMWGKHKFDAFNPLPDKSLEGLQENFQWKTKT